MKSSTYDESSGMRATPEKALCGSVSAKERALKEVVKAWESLPGGRYSAQEVERWLAGPMVKAINKARKALTPNTN
jgi:hypothetical protein